jgi:hypothetical protein
MWTFTLPVCRRDEPEVERLCRQPKCTAGLQEKKHAFSIVSCYFPGECLWKVKLKKLKTFEENTKSVSLCQNFSITCNFAAAKKLHIL